MNLVDEFVRRALWVSLMRMRLQEQAIARVRLKSYLLSTPTMISSPPTVQVDPPVTGVLTAEPPVVAPVHQGHLPDGAALVQFSDSLALGAHEGAVAAAEGPISGPFRLTEVGLLLLAEPTLSDWLACGRSFRKIGKALLFAIGDWLVFSERHLGKDYQHKRDYDEVVKLTELNYHTLRGAKWVAERVPLDRRRSKLSFGLHKEVAPLSASLQQELLERAERERWSVKRMRKEKAKRGEKVGNSRKPIAAPRPKATPKVVVDQVEPELALRQTITQLQRQLKEQKELYQALEEPLRRISSDPSVLSDLLAELRRLMEARKRAEERERELEKELQRKVAEQVTQVRAQLERDIRSDLSAAFRPKADTPQRNEALGIRKEISRLNTVLTVLEQWLDELTTTEFPERLAVLPTEQVGYFVQQLEQVQKALEHAVLLLSRSVWVPRTNPSR